MGGGHSRKNKSPSSSGGRSTSSIDANIVIDGENHTVASAKALLQTYKTDAIKYKEKCASLESEVAQLKRELEKKDLEIHQFQREVDKLKSVLDNKVGIPALPGTPAKQLNAIQEDEVDHLTHSSSTLAPSVTDPAGRNKRQGVSGESGTQHAHVELKYHEKDFKSKQLIKGALLENQFLKHMESSQVREVVECMYEVGVKRGAYIICEGDPGKHLFVSSVGSLEVQKNGKVLGTMEPGRAFGELALLYDCPRTATVRAATDAKVWALDRQVFQTIMMKTNKQVLEEKLTFLKSVHLLKDLSKDQLTKTADALEKEKYTAGQYIVREGEVGSTFFIIRSGQVKVTQLIVGSEQPKEIRTLGRGDYFGEKALLSDDVRTANVIAIDAVEVLALDRMNFIHLIGNLEELKAKDYGDEKRGAKSYRRSTGEAKSSANSLEGSKPLENPYKNVKLEELDAIATLGIGGFGRVELVVWTADRQKSFALKCLKKQHIVDTKQQAHVIAERSILLQLDCEFIIRLYKTFKDKKYVYMLLEVAQGGEVWSILRDRVRFDDTITKFIMACVLSALEYLHTRGIVYRDLKPENLLLDVHGYVKLCDFGFAKIIGKGKKTWTFCGTPEYVSPEIVLNKGHDFAADLWSLGILMFELLTGNPPFYGNDPMRIYNIIIKGVDVIEFPKTISASAHNLIKRLCRESPSERLGYGSNGIDDIRQHKYFQGFDWNGVRKKTLQPPVVPVVKGASDHSNFDKYPRDVDNVPDETSGWDIDF